MLQVDPPPAGRQGQAGKHSSLALVKDIEDRH